MRIDVVTIFPEMFRPVLGASILRRAQEQGRLRVVLHDLRAYTQDERRTVDDRPYGGGPGMVMKPEPVFQAVDALRRACGHQAVPAGLSVDKQDSQAQGTIRSCQTILMSPTGQVLSTPLARELAGLDHLLILCGRYEGVDERVMTLVDRTVSIGDYVLTGGELPAMVVIDCLARFIPGVIGHAQATEEESFSDGWLEYPQYTRPPVFRNMAVPEVLRSGDHQRIARWRRAQSVARTLASRPDLAPSRPDKTAPRG
jgi:tRNA (guanine37-N1)-methyltransferase